LNSLLKETVCKALCLLFCRLVTIRTTTQSCNRFTGNFFFKSFSAGSMALLKEFLRGHWLRWNCFSGVIDSAEIQFLSISRWMRSHMQMAFKLWIRALGGVNLWKNQRSKISLKWTVSRDFRPSFFSSIDYP
jgi:hypothetical protein